MSSIVSVLFLGTLFTVHGMQIPDYGADIQEMQEKLDLIMDALGIIRSVASQGRALSGYEEKPPPQKPNPVPHASSNPYGAAPFSSRGPYQPPIKTSYVPPHQKAYSPPQQSTHEASEYEAEQHKKAGVGYETDKSLNEYESNQVFEGKSELGDGQLAHAGYGKKEKYDTGEYNVVDSTYEVEGRRLNSSDSRTRSTAILASLNNERDFGNKVGYENHEGDYNGAEFDVGYNLNEQDAEYGEFENSKLGRTKYEGTEEYSGGNKHTNGFDAGHYTKYGESSKDARYHDVNIGNGGYDDIDLYDKYNGKDGITGNRGYGNGGYNSYRENGEEELKDEDREFGENFAGEGYYKSGNDRAAGYGFEKEEKGNNYNGRGRLKKLEATGKNKEANYKGDYKTKDNFEKFKDKQNYNITFYQTGSNINLGGENGVSQERTDRSSWKHSEQTGKNDVVYDTGVYYDKQQAKKYDQNVNRNKFRGESYVRRRETSQDDDKYYKAGEGKRDEYYNSVNKPRYY